MAVTVEFFGIPRQRAGVAQTVVEATRFDELLARLALRFPQLAKTCFQGSQLRPTFAANLNGERFIVAPDTPLKPGDAVLILSADAGG